MHEVLAWLFLYTCSCNLTTLFQLQNWPVDWVGWRPWQTSGMDMEGNWCDLFQGMLTVRVFVSNDLPVPIVTAEQPVSCVGAPAEYRRRWSWGTQQLGSVWVLYFRFLKAFIYNHTKVKHSWWGRGGGARNFVLIWQPKNRGLIPVRRKRYSVLWSVSSDCGARPVSCSVGFPGSSSRSVKLII
jgi:hypothetical protein